MYADDLLLRKLLTQPYVPCEDHQRMV